MHTQVPARHAQPAPGWTEGTCWCGCGLPLKREAKFFALRRHYSTTAPDGRLITEFETKWCRGCEQRLTHELFPMTISRYKSNYFERLECYCLSCRTERLNGLHANQVGKRKHLIYQRNRYQSDEYYRERKLAQAREQRRRINADPVLAEEYRKYNREYKRAKAKKRQEAAELQAQEVRKEMDLDRRDPLCLALDDPMKAWLYSVLDDYKRINDASIESFLELGDNWGRWRRQTPNTPFMPMWVVDHILVRLDLQHRFDEFTFKRRSEWLAGSG